MKKCQWCDAEKVIVQEWLRLIQAQVEAEIYDDDNGEDVEKES